MEKNDWMDLALTDIDNTAALKGTLILTVVFLMAPFIMPLALLSLGGALEWALYRDALYLGMIFSWPMSVFTFVWHRRLKSGKANPANF